jgi:osmotically inducible protein OsmC
MATAERQASVTWEGDLAHGNGRVTAGSGAFGPLEVTWASRTRRSEGRTSPEELIAAAHGSCFAMALSHELAQQGHAPERLEVEARCSLDEADGGVRITESRLRVRGRVPGLDADSFRRAAEAAKDGCPVSGALRGNLEMGVEAELEGA